MRSRLVARSSGAVGVLLLSSLVVATIACDIFAIRCNDDDDCPTDVPCCVDDICVNEEEAERRGRDVDDDTGEGEGEGAEGEGEGEPVPTSCASDFECTGGLCYN